MAYPKLIINTKDIEHNVKTIGKILRDNKIKYMAGVTKVFCGDPRVAKAYVDGGVDYLADSRVQNLEKMKDLDCKKILLRLPMESEVEEVVKFADISLNSELYTIKLLNEAAGKLGKKHSIIIMVDLGDLREGYYKEEDFYNAFEEILGLENINIIGIGVNLTCYGAVIPTTDILSRLNEYKENVKNKFDYDLEIISGGNSSSVYLLGKEEIPGVNNLRLGECLILGRETAYGDPIPNTKAEAFKLQAQIIELKEKPSIPTGEIGMDAFGNKPTFVDRGVRKRALIAIGKQDVNNDSIYPCDEDIIILGGSSDHTILDVTDSKKDYKVGDIVEFTLDYGGVLMSCTSEYVEKEII